MIPEVRVPKICVNAKFQTKVAASEVNWLMDCPYAYYAARDKREKEAKKSQEL